MPHKPGLFFITNSSNKAVAAAILLDMQNNVILLSFVSFYFKLQFTTFQKKVSDTRTCMFTQNRTSEPNMSFNCTSTYSALKLIEEMFYQPLKTRVNGSSVQCLLNLDLKEAQLFVWEWKLCDMKNSERIRRKRNPDSAIGILSNPRAGSARFHWRKSKRFSPTGSEIHPDFYWLHTYIFKIKCKMENKVI